MEVKPVIIAVLFAASAGLANAQGVIDLAGPAATPTPSSYPSNIVGVAVRDPWSTVEPTCGDFSHWNGTIAAGIKSAHANGLMVILNVDAAPLSQDQGGPMPDWVCGTNGQEETPVNYQNGTYSCGTPTMQTTCTEVLLQAPNQGSITIDAFWDTQYLNAKHQMLHNLANYLSNNCDGTCNGTNTLMDEVRFIRWQCAGASTEDWNVPHGMVQGFDNNKAWCMQGYSSNKLVNTCESELDFVETTFPNKQVIQAIGDNGSLDPSNQYTACTTNGRSSSDCSSLDSCSNSGPNCVSLALLEYANSNYSDFDPEKDDLHYTSSSMHTPVYDASGTTDGWETLGCELEAGTISNVWEQETLAQGSECALCEAAGLGESFGPTHIEIYPSDLNGSPAVVQDVQSCLKTSSNCICPADTSCSLTTIQTTCDNMYSITCN